MFLLEKDTELFRYIYFSVNLLVGEVSKEKIKCGKNNLGLTENRTRSQIKFD